MFGSSRIGWGAKHYADRTPKPYFAASPVSATRPPRGPPAALGCPLPSAVGVRPLEPVRAGALRSLYRRLAFERHAERGEKRGGGFLVLDFHADAVHFFYRPADKASRGTFVAVDRS